MQIQNDIKRIVIHCTDSRDDSNYSIQNIELDHKLANFPPSSDGKHCGYHYVVDKTGVIHIGRPELEVGCGVAGHNTGSVHVCWIGRASMPMAQKVSLVRIVSELVKKYGLKIEDVIGHKEFPGVDKSCPNFPPPSLPFLSMDEFRNNLKGVV